MNKSYRRMAGDVGAEIVGLNVEELITRLNTAYADEWQAYHQYWIDAKIMVGKMRKNIEGEFNQHADDEKDHAGQIADRIIQLGGLPVLSPADWATTGSCGFTKAADLSVRTVLDDNLNGERCAIRFYQELLNFVRGKDDVTFEMIRDILADEVEHEEDLQMLVEDMDAGWDGQEMQARMAKIASSISKNFKADAVADYANSLLGWGVIYRRDSRELERELNIAVKMLDMDQKQAQHELGKLEGILNHFIDDMNGMRTVVRQTSDQLPMVAGQKQAGIAPLDTGYVMDDASKIPQRFGRQAAIAERLVRRYVAVNKFTRNDIVWMEKDGKPVKTTVKEFHFNGGKGYTYTVADAEKPMAEAELSMRRPAASSK